MLAFCASNALKKRKKNPNFSDYQVTALVYDTLIPPAFANGLPPPPRSVSESICISWGSKYIIILYKNFIMTDI